MFKYFEVRRRQKIKLSDISNKFNSNDHICMQMLELINNNKTNIRLDKDIKNNYYVFLNDTIYLSDREKNKTGYQRICVVAHECIHSIQNKSIQIINFVLSNIELVAFVMSIIGISYKHNSVIFYVYLFINIISCIPRLILELDATLRSVNLLEKYIKDKLDDVELNILLSKYKFQILTLLPVFIISLLIGKIFRILFLCILIKFLK